MSYTRLPDHDIQLVNGSSSHDIPLIEARLQSQSQAGTSHIVGYYLAKFWTSAVNHARNIPWRELHSWHPAYNHVIPILTLCAQLVLFALLASGVLDQRTTGICGNGGILNPLNVFAIDIAYGSLSFANAKAIDIFWDLIIGRGGQALLAYATYLVFTQALTRIMEEASVSHNTFKAITLQQNSFTGFTLLTRDFLTTAGVRAKFIVAWVILAGLFVLALPTWLAAMTGYTADLAPYLNSTGDLVALSSPKFRPLIYTIHDGDRLGQPYTKEYQVLIHTNLSRFEFDGSNRYACTPTFEDVDRNIWEYSASEPSLDCAMMWLVSYYVSIFGFLGLNDTESTFILPVRTEIDNDYFLYNSTIQLTQPSLDISANFAIDSSYSDSYAYYSTYWNMVPFGITWTNPQTKDKTFGTHNPKLVYSVTNAVTNETFDLAKLKDQGKCLQTADRYKWGFSSVLLLSFLVTSFVWTLGIYVLHLDSALHSRLYPLKRAMGVERAVVDLSEPMAKHSDFVHVRLDSNNKLEEVAKGTTITYNDIASGVNAQTGHEKLREWWRDFRFCAWLWNEKYWLLAMLIFTTLLILSCLSRASHSRWSPVWIATPFVWNLVFVWRAEAAFLPLLGTVIVLCLGREEKSWRWLVFVLCFVVFWIVNIWNIAYSVRHCGPGFYDCTFW